MQQLLYTDINMTEMTEMTETTETTEIKKDPTLCMHNPHIDNKRLYRITDFYTFAPIKRPNYFIRFWQKICNRYLHTHINYYIRT